MKKLTERETFVIYAGLTNALVDHIENEKKILERIEHPFIVRE